MFSFIHPPTYISFRIRVVAETVVEIVAVGTVAETVVEIAVVGTVVEIAVVGTVVEIAVVPRSQTRTGRTLFQTCYQFFERYAEVPLRLC